MGTQLTGDAVRQLYEQLPAAVIAVDLDSCVTYWNAGAEELYCWAAAEVLGRSIRDLVLEGQPLADKVAKVTRAGGHWAGEMEIARKDGSRVLVFVHNAPLRDAAGTVVGVVGASTALSAERELEARRAQALLETAERLDETLHRLQRLQSLTTALLAARSREDVLQAVLTAGKDAIGAAAVAVALVDLPSRALRVEAQVGFAEEFSRSFTVVPLTLDTPLSRAYLHQVPQAYSDAAAMQQAYPLIPLDPAFQARAAVPILGPSGCLGGLTLGFHGSRRFGAEEMDVLLAVSRQAGLALDRIELAELQRLRQQRDAFLARATEALTRSLDERAVLRNLLKVLVPEHADAGTVYLRDEQGPEVFRLDAVAHLEEQVQAHRERELLGRRLDLAGTEGPARAVQERCTVLGSSLAVPVLAADGCLAVLCLEREGEPYTPEEVDLLEHVAERVSVALNHATAYQRQRRGALALQLALLPPVRPEIDGMDIGWQYRPGQLPGSAASLIGGDWYDVVPLPERVLLAVGDVMGRGPSAAAVMGQLRTMLRTLVRLSLPLPDCLREMDEELQRIAPDRIATSLVLDVDLERRQMTVANAGHLPPVIWDGEQARLLDLPTGVPLGVGAGPEGFEATDVALGEGALLVLYTDGLVEERDRSLDDRLAELVRHVSELAADDAQASAEAMSHELLVRMGREQWQDDDLALLVVRL